VVEGELAVGGQLGVANLPVEVVDVAAEQRDVVLKLIGRVAEEGEPSEATEAVGRAKREVEAAVLLAVDVDELVEDVFDVRRVANLATLEQ